MEDELRIRTLERDLGRLEGVVESLVKSVSLEHEMARQARADDRSAQRDLTEKMEKAVSTLSEEITRLAQRSADQDSLIGAKAAATDGALGISRWLFASALAIATLIVGFVNSRRSDPPEAPLSCPAQLPPAKP